MCTLLVAHRALSHSPVVVLANRDEMLDRPALPPHWIDGPVRVFGGRDQRDGGTWCGVNELGLFVGLTNRTGNPPDPRLRSRGLLCLDLLRLRDAREAQQFVEAIAPGSYNPHHLLISDGRHGFVAVSQGSTRIEELGPGVHAITNWPREGEFDEKRRLAQGRFEELIAREHELDPLIVGLQQLARTREHQGDPRYDLCCRHGGYGTRCSSIIVLGRECRFGHAEGAPCDSQYADLSSEMNRGLRELYWGS
jgi:uncharacterized protein with NRDE domain